MISYFARRLLLVPVTLLGVTFLVYTITRVMPGSPLERQLQQAADAGGSAGQGMLTEEQLTELEREFGYDQPIGVAYLQWLGLLPRERLHSEADFSPGGEERIGDQLIDDALDQTLVTLTGSGRQVRVVRSEGTARFLDGRDVSEDGWKLRLVTPEDRQATWVRRNPGKTLADAPQNYDHRAILFKERHSGLLQGDLGRSTEFGDPVRDLIADRMPVALYFGLLTALISYGVCLPLGVVKAINHRTLIDNLSSVLIFLGYAVPGFALGAVLVVYLGARLHWFPMMGLTSADFDSLTVVGKIKDLAHHTVLPLACYLVGSFAWLTMMMKNNLMDQLAADYVRTAVAKGVGFRRAVFRHAFRNSFIPIASSLGQLITILVGGSILVETVFDIQGFGLLQYRGILGADQMVIMGTLTVAAALMIVGNILSDVIVAFIDPRVKF